jgi:hypothetical protein
MYIQTHIDDQLFQQATHLTGLADKQALLEESLRILIQTHTKAPQPAHFWEALQRFRATTDLTELGDIDEVFADVRDKDPGRSVEL